MSIITQSEFNEFLANISNHINHDSLTIDIDFEKLPHAKAKLKKLCKQLSSLNIGHISFANNHLNDELGAELISSLNKKTLLALDLSHNQLGKKSCHALAKLLKDNRKLEQLNVSHNDLGGSVTHILKAITKKHQNMTLSIAKTHPDGGKHSDNVVLAMTDACSYLKTLEISNNRFNEYHFYILLNMGERLVGLDSCFLYNQTTHETRRIDPAVLATISKRQSMLLETIQATPPRNAYDSLRLKLADGIVSSGELAPLPVDRNQLLAELFAVVPDSASSTSSSAQIDMSDDTIAKLDQCLLEDYLLSITAASKTTRQTSYASLLTLIENKIPSTGKLAHVDVDRKKLLAELYVGRPSGHDAGTSCRFSGVTSSELDDLSSVYPTNEDDEKDVSAPAAAVATATTTVAKPAAKSTAATATTTTETAKKSAAKSTAATATATTETAKKPAATTTTETAKKPAATTTTETAKKPAATTTTATAKKPAATTTTATAKKPAATTTTPSTPIKKKSTRAKKAAPPNVASSAGSAVAQSQDQAPAVRLHPLFPTPAEAASKQAPVYSDHLPLLMEVPLGHTTLRIASLNMLGANCNASGFHETAGWETEEEAKERYRKIVTGFAALAKSDQNKIDVIALQEINPALIKDTLQQQLGEDWDIIADESTGMVTCYHKKRLLLQSTSVNIPTRTRSLTVFDTQSNLTVDIHNVWGIFNPFPNQIEQQFKNLLESKITNGSQVSILVGDTNSRICPVDDIARNITNGAIPLGINALNGMPPSVQNPDYPDGGYCLDEKGKLYQLISRVFHYETGEFVVDTRTKAQLGHTCEYRMVLCLDDHYKERIVMSDKTIFQYEEELKTTLNEYQISVRMAANSYNEKAIAIRFPVDSPLYTALHTELKDTHPEFQFQHIQSVCSDFSGARVPCLFVPLAQAELLHQAILRHAVPPTSYYAVSDKKIYQPKEAGVTNPAPETALEVFNQSASFKLYDTEQAAINERTQNKTEHYFWSGADQSVIYKVTPQLTTPFANGMAVNRDKIRTAILPTIANSGSEALIRDHIKINILRAVVKDALYQYLTPPSSFTSTTSGSSSLGGMCSIASDTNPVATYHGESGRQRACEFYNSLVEPGLEYRTIIERIKAYAERGRLTGNYDKDRSFKAILCQNLVAKYGTEQQKTQLATQQTLTKDDLLSALECARSPTSRLLLNASAPVATAVAT